MKNRSIHIIIATALFAVLLWISLSMRENYQIQVSAPLVIEGLPPGTAISSPVPRSVQLTFDEIGWKLAKLTWQSELKWVVDLNSMRSLQHALTVKDFAEQFGSRLGIQPMSMKPESFYIILDSLATKKVAVVRNLTLAFRDGYGEVGQPVVKPDCVLVIGARSLLRSIDSWPTAKQTLHELRQPIDVTVPLADTMSHVLTFVPSQVDLHIDVQQFAEKTFTAIPIEVVSVPQNREVFLSSPRLDLVIRGGIEQLAGVNQNTVRASVDYRVILADTSGIIEPEITVPAGVQIVKRAPERLQYVVRKKY